MMNEETPHGKSQKKPSGSRPQTEDDLDFEILDALENIDHTADNAGVPSMDQGDEFDLDLDDDLVFDKEHVGETEEFSIDTDMTAEFSLEAENDDSSQLAGELDEFGLDTNIGDGVQMNENDDGSFSLDLDEDADDVDMSFDDDIDLDLDDNFSGTVSSDLDLGAFNAPSIDMDDETSELDEEELAIVPELDMAPSVSLDRDESEMTPEEFSEELDESFDDEDDEIDIDNMPDLDETMAEFTSAFGSDDGQSDMELADMDKAQEAENFQGKGVISIDGEAVIDLGDEDDISSIADADSPSWDSDDDFHVEDDFFDDANAASDDEDDFFDDDDNNVDLNELAKGAQKIVDNVIDDEPEEQDADFMASLDDINIDLHDSDADEDMDTFGSDADEDFDVSEYAAASEDEESEEDFTVPSISDIFADDQQDIGLEQDFDTVGSHETPPQDEEQPQVDVREALGLVSRLADDEIQKFEQMVLEAKTIQQYIEELEEHKPEVKTAIYVKLLKEYSERKTNIFREPDFVSIRIDVEQDLEDMVRKRDEVQRTVSSLHDELEEVQVRHLVGEYSDEELAEQETSRKTEIDAWQQKTDHLEQFIVQYQELLETENALNSREDEPEPDTAIEETSSLEETETATGLEDNGLSAELESLISEEDDLLEEASTEEEATFEELPSIAVEDAGYDDGVPVEESSVEDENVSLDDLSDEIVDMGDLAGILDDDDSGDWEDEDNEDLELTAESFDEDDFSLDADFADDEELTGLDAEEFEFDGLADVDDATDSDHADDDTLSALAFGETDAENDELSEQDEELVSCKKCGRSTPVSEKFCVNCGAKAR